MMKEEDKPFIPFTGHSLYLELAIKDEWNTMSRVARSTFHVAATSINKRVDVVIKKNEELQKRIKDLEQDLRYSLMIQLN